MDVVIKVKKTIDRIIENLLILLVCFSFNFSPEKAALSAQYLPCLSFAMEKVITSFICGVRLRF
jgi:hypothetical protein